MFRMIGLVVGLLSTVNSVVVAQTRVRVQPGDCETPLKSIEYLQDSLTLIANDRGNALWIDASSNVTLLSHIKFYLLTRKNESGCDIDLAIALTRETYQQLFEQDKRKIAPDIQAATVLRDTLWISQLRERVRMLTRIYKEIQADINTMGNNIRYVPQNTSRLESNSRRLEIKQ